jgi:hypothetical protein
MIQLKVLPICENSIPFRTNIPHPDITHLHRQLRRLGRRVRQRPEEEAARDNRSVQSRIRNRHTHILSLQAIVMLILLVCV